RHAAQRYWPRARRRGARRVSRAEARPPRLRDGAEALVLPVPGPPAWQRHPRLMLTDDYAARCFWTVDAPLLEARAQPLPAAADVVVIGSGSTGLTAGRETALAGRSTLVLDAGEIGGGCSARNGGQVGFSLKPPFAELSARHGVEVAAGLYREAAE